MSEVSDLKSEVGERRCRGVPQFNPCVSFNTVTPEAQLR